MSEAGSPLLDKQQHIKYWQRCHKTYLPSPYTAYDSTRLTFACFIISALDILSVPLTHTERGAIRRIQRGAFVEVQRTHYPVKKLLRARQILQLPSLHLYCWAWQPMVRMRRGQLSAGWTEYGY
ncbi:hypothetical protein LB505_008901 [Fusarium chuoi]|nr:hypothetical protein LB505_008901 [Fusarium chuoi]